MVVFVSLHRKMQHKNARKSCLIFTDSAAQAVFSFESVLRTFWLQKKLDSLQHLSRKIEGQTAGHVTGH